jgi:cob(I)alamin adenosyltransferase
MPKLYTKKGDTGTTCLYDTGRISKSNLVFDVLGDIDELSAHIGVLTTVRSITELRSIQLKLLDISSNIATKNRKTTGVENWEIKKLEEDIDRYEATNKELKEFILPGVYFADANVHVCRAVCRRVERGLCKLENVDNKILAYINRLSDYFFALARHLSGCNETTRREATRIHNYKNCVSTDVTPTD